ncbi:MAG: hypothetical protein GWN58_27755 [Anaerolineae bacterium]|nr:hypothetical protein [Anaerolineae bacterium]
MRKRKLNIATPAPDTPAMPQPRFRLGLLKVLLILIAVGAIAILVGPQIARAINYRPTATELARRAARTEAWRNRIAKIENTLSYTCIGTLVLLGVTAITSLWLGVRWIRALIAQQEEVRAHDGVFPLIVRKAWTWQYRGRRLFPTQIIAVLDPNKNPAPVMVINGPRSETRFELPEAIPPDQRAVTHGAQVVQATAASKGGAPQPQLASFLDQVPQIPPGLMAGQNLPEIEVIDTSHFHRLLDDAGLLDEDQHLPE